MELDELQKELQKYKDLRDKAIKESVDFGWINDIIAGLEEDIAALPQPVAVEAVKPDPVLEEIVLPVDYNTIFGDPRANEEITNLIRQVKAQLVEDHKVELQGIIETHLQLVAGLNFTIDMKQKIIDVGKPENERLMQLVADLESKVITLTAEKTDAEQKRDNAVTDKEAAEAATLRALQENSSLYGQIKELEILLQSYKKPVATHGLSLTTSLKPETDDEKQARLAKEKTDLLNKNLSRFNVDPLPTKVELVTVDQLDDSFRKVAASKAVVPNESGGDRVQETAAPLEQAEDGASKLALEQQLYADVTGLKEQMRIVFDHLELH